MIAVLLREIFLTSITSPGLVSGTVSFVEDGCVVDVLLVVVAVVLLVVVAVVLLVVVAVVVLVVVAEVVDVAVVLLVVVCIGKAIAVTTISPVTTALSMPLFSILRWKAWIFFLRHLREERQNE